MGTRNKRKQKPEINSNNNSQQFQMMKQSLTFTHGVIVTVALVSLMYQMRLFACSSSSTPASWMMSSSGMGDWVGTRDRKDKAGEEVETTQQVEYFKMDVTEIDRILQDSYQRHDIKAGPITQPILLGHYYFQTWYSQDQKQQPSKSSSTTKRKLLPLNDYQKKLLNDSYIDPKIEQARCQRYQFTYNPNRKKRRRIFYGATLADDSFFLLQTIATEGYDLYHTAAFVESNMTHTRSQRDLRFPPQSTDLHLLQTMFGKNTQVTVDYFVPVDKQTIPDEGKNDPFNFNWQHIQREAIVQRWKRNGMQIDDIGFLADADEVFSRDFLRALQICDIPEFEPGQSCEKPKIVSTTLIYEASPECIVSNTKLWKPDVIIGECIEGIGDEKIHKPPERQFYKKYSSRAVGHGRLNKNYEKYFKKYNIQPENPNKMFALWNAADFRNLEGGRQIKMDKKVVLQNAYHFHNFFESTEEIRHKYATYGEPLPKAIKSPLGAIHDDLGLAAACVHGWQNLGERKYYIGLSKRGSSSSEQQQSPQDLLTKGPRRPIFFENEDIRNARHEHLTKLILTDERKYGAVNASCKSKTCTM